MSSTFAGFTVARLGMIASQKGLAVTGQNITNINTLGYTRQRVDQYSFFSGNDGYFRTNNSSNVGTGTLISGISQMRDPYLDIRYRREMASVGSADGKLDPLQQVQAVLDEVGRTVDSGIKSSGLTEQFLDLSKQLQNLNTTNATSDQYETLVRSSANSLCTLLNTYAKSLSTVKENVVAAYEKDVETVNGILQSIRELNVQIFNGDVNGDAGLELRDRRNQLIDDLSQYMKIEVSYGKENIGTGISIETLSIGLVNPETNKVQTKLVDHRSCASIGMNSEEPLKDNDFTLHISELVDPNGVQTSNTNSVYRASELKVPTINPDKNPDAQIGTKDQFYTIEYQKPVQGENNEITYETRYLSIHFEATPHVRKPILDENGQPTGEYEPDEGRKKTVESLVQSIKKAFGSDLNNAKKHLEQISDPNNTVEDGFLVDADGNPLVDTEGKPVSATLGDYESELLEFNKNFDMTCAEGGSVKITSKAIGEMACQVTEIYSEDCQPAVDEDGNILEGQWERAERTEEAIAAAKTGAVTYDVVSNKRAEVSNITDIGDHTIYRNVAGEPVLDENGNPKLNAAGQPYDKNGNILVDEFGNPIPAGTILPDQDGEDGCGSYQTLGSLQSVYNMLTSEGEYSTDPLDNKSIRGIPYYQHAMDSLANKFATEMNKLNTMDADGRLFTEEVGVDANGNKITNPKLAGNLFESEGGGRITAGNIKVSEAWRTGAVNLVAATEANPTSESNTNAIRFVEMLTLGQQEYRPSDIIRTGNEIYSTGEPLCASMSPPFECTATLEYLDANNIPQSKSVTFRVENNKIGDITANLRAALDAGLNQFGFQTSITNEGDTTGAKGFDIKVTEPGNLVTGLHITHPAGVMYFPNEILPGDQEENTGGNSDVMFKGTFIEMFTNTQTILGDDIRVTSAILDTYTLSAEEINTSRDSVSGVDLNEEGMNLLQYQKSFAAACRLMTALDECLDKVINGMGVVGR